jgi:hypothetical protein
MGLVYNKLRRYSKVTVWYAIGVYLAVEEDL